MVARPAKRPMPWSEWTTRSPTVSAETSVRTSLPRLPRVRRTSRSPRMSCSPMTASPAPRSRFRAAAPRRRWYRAARPALRRSLGARGLAGAVLGKKRRQALARALAPAGDDQALALTSQPLGVAGDRIEDIGAFGLALGGEGAPLPAAERDDDRLFRLLRPLERVEHDPCRPDNASRQSASLRNRLSGGTG